MIIIYYVEDGMDDVDEGVKDGEGAARFYTWL